MKISEIWLWGMTCWLEDGSSTQSALTRSSTTWRGRSGERERLVFLLVGGWYLYIVNSNKSYYFRPVSLAGSGNIPSSLSIIILSSYSPVQVQVQPPEDSVCDGQCDLLLLCEARLRLLIWISGGPHSAHTNSANRNLNDLDKNRNWYKWSLSLMRS